MHESWKNALSKEFTLPYFQDLENKLANLKDQGVTIYPARDTIYRAFELTPLNRVKVVILGQDPYHGKGQAHGLSFSVRKGNKIPPSLRNIYKELHSDLGFNVPEHGDLSAWAKNGVFLLNTILTVEEKSPGSHKNIGWEIFTDQVIRTISTHQESVVFILWGAFAQKKELLINESKHLILKAPHPAAEVYQGGKAGFFGSKPFSKANNFLDELIDWSLV